MEASRSGRPVFARFKDLTTGGGHDLAGTFQNFASSLTDAGFDATIEFHIRVGPEFRTFSVRAKDHTATASAGPATDADIVLITAEETWQEIAAGRLSPLDAFGDGKLRLRGNTALGSKVLKHLAGTPGRVEIC